jgi:hypothetical protein
MTEFIDFVALHHELILEMLDTLTGLKSCRTSGHIGQPTFKDMYLFFVRVQDFQPFTVFGYAM